MRNFFFLLLLASSFAFAKSDWVSLALVGDAGSENSLTRQLRQSIASQQIQNVALLGDNLYDANFSYEQIWNPWRQLGLRFPIVAIGNHTSGYTEEMRYFHMPAEAYSVKTPGARFIVLNSDNLSTAYSQAVWFEKEIDQAVEPLIFVIFHHPPITLSRRHNWEEKKDFQIPIRQIIYKHRQKISGIFVGHDHLASFIQMEGIPLIVSGASFESFQGLVLKGFEGLFHVKTHWLSRGEFFWTRLDFNSRTAEAWINFVRFFPTKKVICTVRINPRPWIFQNECAQK